VHEIFEKMQLPKDVVSGGGGKTAGASSNSKYAALEKMMLGEEYDAGAPEKVTDHSVDLDAFDLGDTIMGGDATTDEGMTGVEEAMAAFNAPTSTTTTTATIAEEKSEPATATKTVDDIAETTSATDADDETAALLAGIDAAVDDTGIDSLIDTTTTTPPAEKEVEPAVPSLADVVDQVRSITY
jgi:hypothetical protein